MNINRISVFFERAIFLHTFWSGSFSRFPFLENGRGVFFSRFTFWRTFWSGSFSRSTFLENSRGEKCFAPTLLVNVSGPFLYHDGHVHPDTFPF